MDKPNPSRWEKGRSGNPAGRKPGTGEVARLRAQIAQDVPEIIKSVTAAAKGGDIGAARLLLERVLPALKPAEETIAVPLPGETLTEQGRAALDAVAEGRLAPGQGAALLASLGSLAKLAETDELETPHRGAGAAPRRRTGRPEMSSIGTRLTKLEQMVPDVRPRPPGWPSTSSSP